MKNLNFLMKNPLSMKATSDYSKEKSRLSKNQSKQQKKRGKASEREAEEPTSYTEQTNKSEGHDSPLTPPPSAENANDGRELTAFPWYHGLMPRDEINEMLVNDGDFLVRKTDVNGTPRYAVSVFYKGRVRHILLNYKDGIWWLREIRSNTISDLIKEHVDKKVPVQTEGTLLVKLVPRPEYYILHDHIKIGIKVGGGAFGDVHIGQLTLDGHEQDVAIKKLKGAMTKKQRSEFMKEAKLMRRFSHKNIVRTFGVAAQEEPIMIVLELAPNGCLKSKLHDQPKMAVDKLNVYVIGACRGMTYLAANKIIHRDVAARNCLLGFHDEVKISDFGLSVAGKALLKLDKLKQMPIRWLSPETLKRGEFSTKSDVWSFGVLVWEIFTRCKTDPFPNMNNAAARAKITSNQLPMSPPADAPPIMKSVLILCFTQDPERRPDFERILKMIAPNELPPQCDKIASTPNAPHTPQSKSSKKA